MKNINKRIDSNIAVSENVFLSGLIDVTDFLCSSLKVFLEKEGRYLGIVKSYINSLDAAYENFNEDLVDEDYEFFGKILYLVKPIILREFSRLRSKKLSEGDCVILIIKKLTDIILEYPDFSHKKTAKTVRKIINSFYENIKNRNKKDSMYVFSNYIKNFKSSGSIGKYTLDKLDLVCEKKEKEIYTGSELLIGDDSDSKIVEQTLWKGNQ